MKAQVMKRAWEIAKEAVKNFGGAVKEFFAQALKMAWAEIKKGVNTMEIKAMIDRYGIRAVKENGEYTGDIQVTKSWIIKDKVKEVAEIKEKKGEILSFIKAEETREKAEFEERERKIRAIEGLQEIKDAVDDLASWNEEFERSFDNVGGLGVRPRPVYDFEEMHKKYPVASAYLKAEKMANKSNFALARIGSKALERIINGENHELVMRDMEVEENAFVEAHVWD